jgi:hypothetical protein
MKDIIAMQIIGAFLFLLASVKIIKPKEINEGV